MSLREHVSLREHACVSSRGAQSTELVWILDFKQILLLLLSVDDITKYNQYVDLYLDSMYQLSHCYVKITTVITHTIVMN